MMDLSEARGVIDEVLRQAVDQRASGNWRQAIALYVAAERILPDSAPIKHNLGLCHFAVGDLDRALAYCQQAQRLQPSLWQAAVIEARIWRARGEPGKAARALQECCRRCQGTWDGAPALLELASLELNEFGKPRSAIERVRPLLHHPQHRAEAELTGLLAKLYDRDETEEALSAKFIAFARRELQLALAPETPPRPGGAASGRPRVGLISPLFNASPVYFLAFGPLSKIAGSADLIVFNRGQSADWATAKFRALASDWHDVAHLSAEALAILLRRNRLDVLIDMGGWMDPIALRALSAKPADRMYKWVGGQSVTTGLRAFDGMLCDMYQAPPALQHLYSEPLINLKSGYVTYTPPPYMPRPPLPGTEEYDYAVLGNPAKISRELVDRLVRASPIRGGTLAFIDRRYHHEQTTDVVGRLQGARSKFERIITLAPDNHEAYLRMVSRSRMVIDTAPYNCGLTAIEAIYLGRSILTMHGRLFCSRHTYSHLRYSDYGRVESLSGFELYGCQSRVGQERMFPRLRHESLAEELMEIIAVGTGRKAA